MYRRVLTKSLVYIVYFKLALCKTNSLINNILQRYKSALELISLVVKSAKALKYGIVRSVSIRCSTILLLKNSFSNNIIYLYMNMPMVYDCHDLMFNTSIKITNGKLVHVNW